MKQGPLTSRSFIEGEEESQPKKKGHRAYKQSRGSRVKVKRSKHQASPRSQNDQYLNEDSQTLGQFSLDYRLDIGVVGNKKLDKVDKYAIKNWRKNVKRRKKKKEEVRRSNSGEINDLRKIIGLYKIYGNDGLALVNPAENPGVLQVRKRSAERRKIQRQMGLVAQPAVQTNQNGSMHLINDPSLAFQSI